MNSRDALVIASHSRVLGITSDLDSSIESIRMRIGSFFASQWYQLENGLNHLPLPTGWRFRPDLHIVWSFYYHHLKSTHSSRLYHTKAIAERVERTRMFQSHSDTTAPTVPFFLRFQNDRCTVSMEIGGNYKRGYRVFVGDTPLRETIAAAGNDCSW